MLVGIISGLVTVMYFALLYTLFDYKSDLEDSKSELIKTIKKL